MAEQKSYIAVDLGAESGRVMLAVVSDERLTLEEIHRFGNGPVDVDGTLRWDFERLMSEIKTGIGRAVKQASGEVCGIGVDSWGVDFGLLDETGLLIEKPYHYRDSRTNAMMEKAFELMDKRQIYEHTGLQFMQFNTVYQLLAMRLADSPALAKAKSLIFIADLVSYFLCGRAFAEYTLASTSQLMDMRTGRWSQPVFAKLGLPFVLMPPVVQPGRVVGKLTEDVAEEIGCERLDVIAVGSHDTASAVAAVPADEKTKWAYLSSGTWSLIGVEAPGAVINDKTYEVPFTNEGGVENTIRLLKNIMGLWLVQECRRQWQKDGEDLSYPELTAMAEKAEPFAVAIDVDQDSFIAPGGMPKRINEYLEQTGQQRTTDKGQIVRAVLEGLALKYRAILDKLEDVTGTTIECLHIVGGGTQNELLNQFAANATGKKVITGPVEATAIGNIVMQARAAGQLTGLAQARKIIRNSIEMKEYQPEETGLWQRQYDKTKK